MATRVTSQAETEGEFVRRKQVSVSNDATMHAVVDCGELGEFHTDEPEAHGGQSLGPSPLQAVLGALCGCESVTFNRTAAEWGFDYEGIQFGASFTIDIRGRKGDRSVRPHFQRVRVEARVTTRETEERLREVVEETEARCPVYNLVSDAGVDVDVVWVRVPSVG